MERVPMTKEGEQALREELRRLKQEERPKIVAEIATAREHGDLRENAEYHAAREKQSFTEGRILDIEARLASSQVIDVKKLDAGGKIVFGSTVSLYDRNKKKNLKYRIVGEDEADIAHGKISYDAPLARTLLGKVAGDVAVVQAPGGDQTYDIKKVEYI